MEFGYEDFLPENLRYAVSPPDLENLDREEVISLSEQGGRDTKNAAILSLQQAVDARIEGSIGDEEYEKIRDEAVESVTAYYSGDEPQEVHPPDTEISTRQSGFLTHETVVRHFPDSLKTYEGIDTVMPIASGGLEPGILAAEELDAELKILRYSTNDHGDEEPVDLENDYFGEDILVVDDTRYTGETMETVKNHVLEQGANTVETEAVTKGRIHGTANLVESYMKDMRERFSY